MNKQKYLSLILTLTLLLSVSCSRFQKRSDDAIVTDIKAKMFSDPALNASDLKIVSAGGVVTISGNVPDETAHLNAYKIATQTDGVSKVNDEIAVATIPQNPPSTPEASASLTTPAPQPAKPKSPAKSPVSPAPKKDSADNAKVTSTDNIPSTPTPAPAAAVAPVTPPPPPPPQPVTVTVPENTIVTVRTIDNIDSSVNNAGQVFKASLDAPIVVNDKVIVPSGSDAFLKLVSASSAGRMTGRSELTLELTSVVFQGKTYNIASNDVKQSGASRGKRTAATVGGGAALGALIGAIAGGGKGAAIGAGVGAGAGTGVQVFTKGQQVKIPSETRLDFTLQQSVDITYLPSKRSHKPAAPASPNDQPQQ